MLGSFLWGQKILGASNKCKDITLKKGLYHLYECGFSLQEAHDPKIA